MTLDKYFKKPGSMNLTTMAKRLDYTKGRLSQLRFSNDMPPKIALQIEKLTDGELDASKLSKVIKEARA